MSSGGYVYHVLNRGVGRMTLFETDEDYAAFERALAEAVDRRPGIRLLGYCIMPSHWHLVVWRRGDDDLSEFMRWLTMTHTQRLPRRCIAESCKIDFRRIGNSKARQIHGVHF